LFSYQMKSPVWIAVSIIITVLIASTEGRGHLRSTSSDNSIQCREGCANCFAFQACMRNHIYEARYEDPQQVLATAREDCHEICDR
ncbi:hypothetical protein PENTCL1PPCAC_9931, partial [Pristionchus entomophagus]